MKNNDAPVRSFLKWAGGKSKMAPKIASLVLPETKRIIEPFAGSCSVSLNIPSTSYGLFDINADLINTYKLLIECRNDFIEECRELFVDGNNRSTYEARRNEFNHTDIQRRKACLFVYLNRHCFNGLVRYNSAGMFNTPFGRYTSPYFPLQEMKIFIERLGGSFFGVSDFRTVMGNTGKGDFVYCDPPYVALDGVGFTAYSKGSFSDDDQRDLALCCEQAVNREAVVVVSNHDTPFARSLYDNATYILQLDVPRFISCNGAGRKTARELMAIYA